MSDQFENINLALGSESFEVEHEPKIIKNIPIDNEIESDQKYARENLYDMVEKGQDALDQLLEIAKNSQSHRAYEVAAVFMKNLADVTDKLLQSQKTYKEITDESTSKKTGPSTVNNSVFIGSTAELQKMLKELNSKKE